MSELLYVLALLACPVGMGAMMWMMSRGHASQPQPTEDERAELTRRRAEIDAHRSAPPAAAGPDLAASGR